MSDFVLDATDVMQLPPEFTEDDAPTIRRPRSQAIQIDGPRSASDAQQSARGRRPHRGDLSKLIAAIEADLEVPTAAAAPRSRVVARARSRASRTVAEPEARSEPITMSSSRVPKTLVKISREEAKSILTSAAPSARPLPLASPTRSPRMARGTEVEDAPRVDSRRKPGEAIRGEASATGLVTVANTETLALSTMVEWLGRILLVAAPILAGAYLLAWLGLARDTEVIFPIAVAATTATFVTQGLLGRYCSLSLAATGLGTWALCQLPIAVGAWPATTFLLGAIAVSVLVGGLLLAANNVAARQ